MALSPLQRDVCRLLADRRRSSGESYVAGGVALGEALASLRVSRDLDIFHDTTAAVASSWDADRQTLEQSGFSVQIVRERPGFVEAVAEKAGASLLIEWARDSAFRFFPLVEHDDLGLTLHPFDLATNKVLALVGRLEPRDWIDTILAADRLQPLGYLAWAACGKDPGFTPQGVMAHARRSGRYTQAEISALAFEGQTPSAAALGRRWHDLLNAGDDVVRCLPAADAGEAVLTRQGELARWSASELETAIRAGDVQYHQGRIGGAWPTIVNLS